MKEIRWIVLLNSEMKGKFKEFIPQLVTFQPKKVLLLCIFNKITCICFKFLVIIAIIEIYFLVKINKDFSFSIQILFFDRELCLYFEFLKSKYIVI